MFLTRTFRTQALIALAAIGLPACMRFLDTPDPWPCAVDQDCEDGRVCFSKQCLSAHYCESSSDCTGTTVCVAHACVPVQCTAENAAICAPYACQSNACSTSCTNSSDCDSEHACEAKECIPR